METGEYEVEPKGVFGSEGAGEDVVMGIVEIEFGLDANDMAGNFLEGDDGLFELVGVWDVFGVVDD